MPLKSFTDLYQIDLSADTRKKPTFYKDKDGKPVKTTEDKWLEYIEWSTVLTLLHKHGAQKVSFGSKISTTKVHTLEVFVDVDGERYLTDYPIIDGSTVIPQPNQMHIHRAELRGFVKCVAIHTGLGLSLWQKEETIMNEIPPIETPPTPPKEPVDMAVIAQWTQLLGECKTVAALGALYNDNKAVIETNPDIKAMFVQRKGEIPTTPKADKKA